LEAPRLTPTAPDAQPSAGPGSPEPEGAEKRGRHRLLRIAAGVALLVAVVWTLHDVVWGALWRSLKAARPGWAALAAAVNLLAVFFQALRWLAVVQPLSRAATVSGAFRAMVVGFAVSMVVPARAGELARIQWLARRTGIPKASLLSTIILDYLVNAAGLLLGLALLPFLLPVPSWIRPGALFTLALFVVGAAMVFGVGAKRTPAATGPPARGLAGFLARARHGLAAVRRPKALGLSFGASLVSWALEIEATLLAMKAVGLHLGLPAAVLALLSVNVALALPFAPPGNVGTLEVGATLALMAFGVRKEQALAFGLVYHVMQLVPLGALGLVFAGRSVRKDGPD